MLPRDSVLHVVAMQRIQDPETGWNRPQRLEAWLDDGNRRYRVTRWRPDGDLMSDLSVIGARSVQYRPGIDVVEEHTYEDHHAPELGQARRVLTRYEELLALGVGQETGADEQGGRPLLIIDVPPRSGDGQAVRAFVDARTLAPVMEEVYRPSRDGYALVSAMASDYVAWEALPTSSVNDAEFEVPAPPGATRSIHRNMGLSTAAKLSRPPYYLGPFFQGIPVRSMETVRREGGRMPPMGEVHIVTYAPQRDFWEMPSAPIFLVSTQELPASGMLPAGALTPGTVTVDPGGSARATIVLEGCLVGLGGPTEEAVRTMMAALVRVGAL